jgi:CxxC motif-containing protein (DUF1111 family)
LTKLTGRARLVTAVLIIRYAAVLVNLGAPRLRSREMRLFCLAWLVLSAPAQAERAALRAFEHAEHNRDAFARPASALSAAELRVFHFGNRLFNTNWTIAPASASAFDGLGPTFNRVSCSGCHVRDGRGRPPIDAERSFDSALLRISLPGKTAQGGPVPVPGYGLQINDRAIPGVPAEAVLTLRWETTRGSYGDGTPYTLRKPHIQITKPAFGALPSVHTSFRVAPAVFGLGLLEAVPEATLRALADPLDDNKDGISGRVNVVWSISETAMRVGRFGWKAGVASLIEQNADAALGDIGISTDLLPAQNCPDKQTACQKAQHGGAPELSAEFLQKLTQYTQMLGVPTPRQPSTQARRGEALFSQFGCDGCHLPLLKTGSSSLTFLHEQSFAAYTDLLLHDMGAGLADGRAEFSASAQEWRTAPLWGLGLLETVNGHQFLLHDGRARGPAEAILWHGGEATRSRENFRTASKAEREALIAFLLTL